MVHTIWAHMDEWEGQQFNTAPGSLVSPVRHMHLDPRRGFKFHIEVDHVLPPVVVPPDDRMGEAHQDPERDPH